MSESHDPHPATHDDAHAHDVAKHVNAYKIVGLLLLAFTGLTVFLSYVDFNKWFGAAYNWNFIVGMAVATFKAGLVAAVFMHLNSERWTIYRVLLLTVFFVAGLFALSILGFHDHIHQ
jgi:caa(3)-type oxidase subunit IV